jgi:hypothetical protein
VRSIERSRRGRCPLLRSHGYGGTGAGRFRTSGRLHAGAGCVARTCGPSLRAMGELCLRRTDVSNGPEVPPRSRLGGITAARQGVPRTRRERGIVEESDPRGPREVRCLVRRQPDTA